MAESYFTTLTNTGKAMFANAPVLNKTVSFATLAVGDGNGSYAELTLEKMLKQTALTHEVWRGSINHISNHEENSNWIVVEGFIPSDVGDFDIREVGLLDQENNLLAIGKYPLTYKPKIEQGASKDLYVKMILEVTETALVTLKVDPTVVIATRQHVADELAAYPNMVRQDAQGNVAITGNLSIGGKDVKTAAHADIMGVVSQAGGVPTGAIIERGSNANGEYIRWADGTQICFITFPKTYTSQSSGLYSYTQILPAQFVGIPICTGCEYAPGTWLRIWERVFSANTTAAELYLKNTVPNPLTYEFKAAVIGRWYE